MQDRMRLPRGRCARSRSSTRARRPTARRRSSAGRTTDCRTSISARASAGVLPPRAGRRDRSIRATTKKARIPKRAAAASSAYASRVGSTRNVNFGRSWSRSNTGEAPLVDAPNRWAIETEGHARRTVRLAPSTVVADTTTSGNSTRKVPACGRHVVWRHATSNSQVWIWYGPETIDVSRVGARRSQSPNAALG